MFEKVNPAHPDKMADRIAGAIVDMAYDIAKDPRIAVEVLLGHGNCNIIIETSIILPEKPIRNAVRRIAGDGITNINILQVSQDELLAKNQEGKIRCGDNGIFKGAPITDEQNCLDDIATVLYDAFKSDGKYIIDDEKIIVCQSGQTAGLDFDYKREVILNPLGPWTGGTAVDCGATNRKLGSDMGDAVTGGGLHGKDLSKSDVSVNIYAHLLAQSRGETVELDCAIGDEKIDGISYDEIVEIARSYIFDIVGGFEKFAEWGLVHDYQR